MISSIQTMVMVTCPHCQLSQRKQIKIDGIEFEYRAGQVLTCTAVHAEACGKDFVVYYRSQIEVKTAMVSPFYGEDS